MRAAVIVAIGAVLLCVQNAAFGSWPAAPNLLVPLALYLGYSREPLRAAILAGALGYLADLLGGGPRGLQILLAMILSLAASGAALRLNVRGPLATSLLALFASVVHQLLTIALLAAFYRAFAGPGLALGQLLPVAVATAIMAGPVFWICNRTDTLGRRAKERKPTL